MFKIGDFFEVKDKGHLGHIINIFGDTVWVEWQSFPGKYYDYKTYQAYPEWITTNKTFNKSSGAHAAGLRICGTPRNFKPTSIDEKMLDFFESLLDECRHDFISYQGFNEKYDFCKHCDQKMPYQHLK